MRLKESPPTRFFAALRMTFKFVPFVGSISLHPFYGSVIDYPQASAIVGVMTRGSNSRCAY